MAKTDTENCSSTVNSVSDSSAATCSKEQLLGEKVLCIHCNRTTTNGIRCLGMCVADNDY